MYNSAYNLTGKGDFMQFSFEEIREKEVIIVTDGACFGFADDIIFDLETKNIVAIVIKKRPKILGIFGGKKDVLVDWNSVENIGKDIISVKTEQNSNLHNSKPGFLEKFFKIFLS